ncbi:MAG: rhomboid family intramembrane serine protease [Planctomycetota bacterium]
MAWSDRPYTADENFDRGGAPGIRGGPGGVLIWLVLINVLIYISDSILTGSARGNMFSPSRWGWFSLAESWQLWRFVTYQFLHAGIFHLIGNLIFLWIFGQFMEMYWGSKRFLAFYLICGIGGAVVFGLVSLIPEIAHTQPMNPLVGASGSIFGLMVGSWMKFPKQELRFFLMPFGMTVQLICGLYVFFNVLQVLAGSYGAGSATAHLGGALFGFLLVKWPAPLNFADRFSAQAIQDGYNQGRHERKVKKERASREEVDRILEKVSEKGLQSLTKREKKILQQDTDRLRGG